MGSSIIFSILAGIWVHAVLIDMREQRLPDTHTLTAAVLALGLRIAQGQGVTALAGAAAGYALLKGTQLICRAQGFEGMGSGDAKLMLSIGAVTGAEGVCWSIAVACILALIVNLGKPHGTRLAFGPYLVAGGLTVCCMQR